MKRDELIDAVAAETGLSKAATKGVIAAVIGQIQSAVARKDKVMLPGFGVFEAIETSERKGRNLHTGAEVTIAAGMRPKFSPGKAFKDAVNGR